MDERSGYFLKVFLERKKEKLLALKEHCSYGKWSGCVDEMFVQTSSKENLLLGCSVRNFVMR